MNGPNSVSQTNQTQMDNISYENTENINTKKYINSDESLPITQKKINNRNIKKLNIKDIKSQFSNKIQELWKKFINFINKNGNVKKSNIEIQDTQNILKLTNLLNLKLQEIDGKFDGYNDCLALTENIYSFIRAESPELKDYHKIEIKTCELYGQFVDELIEPILDQENEIDLSLADENYVANYLKSKL